MKIIRFGEHAILVNFEQKISEKINDKVLSLNEKIKNYQGVTGTIPAYCSLTVRYNDALTSFDKLSDQIASIDLTKTLKKANRSLTLPICYSDQYALDLAELADQLKLEKNKIIELHNTQEYKVYMMGFLPGFGYMGKLPDQLNCLRKTNPRKQVPAQSVGIAGLQTGIYPFEAPGGWQIIGKTPVPLISKNYNKDFLLRAGDKVRFIKISEDQFAEIASSVESGNFNFEQLYD